MARIPATLAQGGAKEVEFFGRSVIVTRQGGRVKVYANVCTHLGGPLSLDGEVLRCDVGHIVRVVRMQIGSDRVERYLGAVE